MLITLSCRVGICQSVAEVQLTDVPLLGALNHRFNFLNFDLTFQCLTLSCDQQRPFSSITPNTFLTVYFFHYFQNSILPTLFFCLPFLKWSSLNTRLGNISILIRCMRPCQFTFFVPLYYITCILVCLWSVFLQTTNDLKT